MKYVVYQEGKHYVAQCLNVDVSSFGNDVDEAAINLQEAVQLFMEDQPASTFLTIGDVRFGERHISG